MTDASFYVVWLLAFFFSFPDVKLGFESAPTGLYFQWKVLITVNFKNPSGVSFKTMKHRKSVIILLVSCSCSFLFQKGNCSEEGKLSYSK